MAAMKFFLVCLVLYVSWGVITDAKPIARPEEAPAEEAPEESDAEVSDSHDTAEGPDESKGSDEKTREQEAEVEANILKGEDSSPDKQQTEAVHTEGDSRDYNGGHYDHHNAHCPNEHAQIISCGSNCCHGNVGPSGVSVPCGCCGAGHLGTFICQPENACSSPNLHYANLCGNTNMALPHPECQQCIGQDQNKKECEKTYHPSCQLVCINGNVGLSLPHACIQLNENQTCHSHMLTHGTNGNSMHSCVCDCGHDCGCGHHCGCGHGGGYGGDNGCGHDCFCGQECGSCGHGHVGEFKHEEGYGHDEHNGNGGYGRCGCGCHHSLYRKDAVKHCDLSDIVSGENASDEEDYDKTEMKGEGVHGERKNPEKRSLHHHQHHHDGYEDNGEFGTHTVVRRHIGDHHMHGCCCCCHNCCHHGCCHHCHDDTCRNDCFRHAPTNDVVCDGNAHVVNEPIATPGCPDAGYSENGGHLHPNLPHPEEQLDYSHGVADSECEACCQQHVNLPLPHHEIPPCHHCDCHHDCHDHHGHHRHHCCHDCHHGHHDCCHDCHHGHHDCCHDCHHGHHDCCHDCHHGHDDCCHDCHHGHHDCCHHCHHCCGHHQNKDHCGHECDDCVICEQGIL